MTDICAPQIRRGGRVGRRSDYLALLMILLVAFAHPLVVRMLYDYNATLAIYLPTIFFVFVVCLVCPHPIVPVCVLLAIFAVQIPPILTRDNSTCPSLLQYLMNGHLNLLGVPIAAVALGLAAVIARKRISLWPWKMKSNLRILAYRPMVFVRAYRWPMVILLLGALLDTITTMDTMYSYGASSELHPGIRAMVQQFGITFGMPAGTIIRLGLVLFVAAIWRRWCGAVMIFCGILYALAAMSNHYLWL